MKFGCNWSSNFRGEVVLNCGRTDGGRATEPAYTISSPRAFGSGELIKRQYHKYAISESKGPEINDLGFHIFVDSLSVRSYDER